ncbi:MAG: UDP-N-acetylglucosamine 2-epimerase (non-hydrolyzing) [Magnetococcales bacterium]|nr:UDP-N-acetylglucosamine 2-epimerase (non-hydrolyzing) [Magnetococcales bacterium]
MTDYSPILCVVGARPNFIKIAPILSALRSDPISMPARLVHTGQHYDDAMKETFFRQLGIPDPDVDLGVGSGSHAAQTAEIMKRFEPEIDRSKPEAVLVVGDVNSTLACALVAAKKGIPVIHVEAGLRSFDRTMPEEINRILTDQLSDLLFTTERDAKVQLVKEGIRPKKVHFVGNVMIDSLTSALPKIPKASDVVAEQFPELDDFSTEPGSYGVMTLHRPANVDDPEMFERIAQTIRDVSRRIPLIFPVHPRTQARIKQFGLEMLIGSPPRPGLPTGRILMMPPVGYMEILSLMAGAKMVLTDSGGIQEETTALGIPCLTMRENTERPITVEQGANTIVGTDPDVILSEVNAILQHGGKAGKVPELWDGQAALRIARVLKQRYGKDRAGLKG